MMKFLFYGDPHGVWTPLVESVQENSPDVIILLGDMELDETLDTKMESLLGEDSKKVWWIHGNHDCHSMSKLGWYDNLFNTEGVLKSHNLDGRVVDFSGVKVAGLGGHFQKPVWHPNTGLNVIDREGWFKKYPRTVDKWRGGLPIKRRAAIWKEDYDRLIELKADILVTHEAPESHQHGFNELGLLAKGMEVKLSVHGHLHDSYEKDMGGYTVFGVSDSTPKLINI